MAICRFCKQPAAEDWLVKYGTRHYAHPDCYLKAGKKVEDLSQWERSQFRHKYTDWKHLVEARGFR